MLNCRLFQLREIVSNLFLIVTRPGIATESPKWAGLSQAGLAVNSPVARSFRPRQAAKSLKKP
jgi:hypothetical protein